MLRTLCLTLALAAALAGCAVRTAPDAARGAAVEQVSEAAWPARDPDLVAPLVDDRERIATAIRRSVVMIEGAPVQGTMEVTVRIVGAAPHGRGVIREVEPVDQPAGLERQTLRFISSWTLEQMVRYGRRREAGTSGPVSLARAAEMARNDPLLGLELDILPPLTSPARGYVVWLHSLGGDRYERPVIEAMRRRGWAVIESDFPWMAWSGQLTMLRTDRDWSHAGADFAERFDQRLAEWTYAIEAALSYLEKASPDVPTDRVCVAGFSAGAICGPTIAAGLGERVRAVALVGGGVDILRISQTNGLTNAGVGFGALDPVEDGFQPRELRREELDELSSKYLEASTLDPYHTAPALAGTPTLMLHAALDQVVPASAGRILYERLGRPERWTFWLGHSLLFWRLPAYAESIASWLDSAAMQDAGAR